MNQNTLAVRRENLITKNSKARHMNLGNRLLAIFNGIIFASLGLGISIMENPIIGRYAQGWSTFRWVGWLLFAYGLTFFLTNIRGLLTDRKKYLTDLARCKARREQEEAAAKSKDSHLTNHE